MSIPENKTRRAIPQPARRMNTLKISVGAPEYWSTR